MNDIYEWVKTEEINFKTNRVELSDGWFWGFWEHVRRSFLYKNSQFTEANENRRNRPFKNIVRSILFLQYWTEGFDAKDIEIYVNEPENYHKSFIVKKYYEKWALEYGFDTFIDEVVESYVDYGGVLVKNVDDIMPDVVKLQTIAFCDQTDFLSGPFAI